MSDDLKGGFRGTIAALTIGVFFMLLAIKYPEISWDYFWGLATLTGVVILLRIFLAVYYAGVRKGERRQIAPNPTDKED